MGWFSFYRSIIFFGIRAGHIGDANEVDAGTPILASRAGAIIHRFAYLEFEVMAKEVLPPPIVEELAG